MPTSRIVPCIIVVLSASVLNAGCVAKQAELVSRVENCESKFLHDEAEDIADLIRQSKFIGLYYVEDREALDTNEDNGTAFDRLANAIEPNYFDFKLTLKKALFLEAPESLTLEGLAPEISNIDRFFFLPERHKVLVVNNDLHSGLARKGINKEGVCDYVGYFIPRFTYLIFGSANSAAAYEPILDSELDPFYREVVRQLNERN